MLYLRGGVGPRGSEDTGGCEVPNMDTENLTKVLGKRAPHFLTPDPSLCLQQKQTLLSNGVFL